MRSVLNVSLKRRAILLAAVSAGLDCGLPLVGTAQAQTSKVLPTTTLVRQVAGVNVSIPVTLTVSRATPQAPVILRADFGLADLFAKSNDIAIAMGVERIDLDGGRLEHRGTAMNLEGNRLRVKVHFKLRLNPLPSSNGSVTGFFVPQVTDNSIGMTAQDVNLAISNELVRGAASALNIDDQIERQIKTALDDALSQPDAMLSLPPQAAALGVTITSSVFVVDNGQPLLRVEGTLPPLAAILFGL